MDSSGYRPNPPSGATRTAARALTTLLLGADPRPSWLAGRPAWIRRLVIAVLAVLTVGLYELATIVIRHVHPSVGPWAPLLAAAQVLPLPLIVRYPLLGWRLGYLAAVLAPLLPERPWGTWLWDPVQIPVFGLAFCVSGLRYARAVLWTMWALMVPLLWLLQPDRTNSAGGTVALTLLAVLLDALSAQRRTRRALAVQTDLSERESGRRTVLEERARIARELHDVVAHHMSLIAVQAETAPYRHDGVPEPVREEFRAIGDAAREALTEMRRLLGVLRSEDAMARRAAVQRAPQPDLSGLPDLVEGARRAGVRVELTVRGQPPPVPATVGLCGYRIVQESLSNVGRHAAGATVEVTIRYEPEAIRLDIVNGPGPGPGPSPGRSGSGPGSGSGPDRSGSGSGPGPGSDRFGSSPGADRLGSVPGSGSDRFGSSPGADRLGSVPGSGSGSGSGSGHGLAGMRERVALLGGELSTGPTADGGFSVRAILPLAAA